MDKKDLHRGVVDWYVSEKGYGVIRGDDGQEYFIHNSNLPVNLKKLSVGIRVSFQVKPRDHKPGMEAINVKIDEGESSRDKLVSNQHEKNQMLIPDSTTDQIVESDDLIRSSTIEPLRNLIFNTTQYRNYSKKSPDLGKSNNQIKAPREVYFERVKGVTYEGRQGIVAILEEGEELKLVREPNNPYDPNAIRVERLNGQQVGYIRRSLAKDLARAFDKYGNPVKAIVHDITGGNYPGSRLGVRIKFTHPFTGKTVQDVEEPDPILSPTFIQDAKSGNDINMNNMPAGSYKLIKPHQDQVRQQDWKPNSIGYQVVWRSLRKSGYKLLLE